MAKIGAEQPKPHRKAKRTLRTLLLVAVIAALMGTAAYAAQGFDPTRRSFWHHPQDPKIRKRADMKYNKRREVFLEHVPDAKDQ
jgi:Skp family chaperone for outer membrane proteins